MIPLPLLGAAIIAIHKKIYYKTIKKTYDKIKEVKFKKKSNKKKDEHENT